MAKLSIAAAQARVLATLVFDRARKPGIKSDELTKLVQSWDTLRERERILRGRPLPGSLRPTKQRKVRRAYNIGVPVEGDIELVQVASRGRSGEGKSSVAGDASTDSAGPSSGGLGESGPASEPEPVA